MVKNEELGNDVRRSHSAPILLERNKAATPAAVEMREVDLEPCSMSCLVWLVIFAIFIWVIIIFSEGRNQPNAPETTFMQEDVIRVYLENRRNTRGY